MSAEAYGQRGSPPAISETTPLVAAEPIPINDGATEENGEHFCSRNSHVERPLPVKQVFILCYARMVEPMAFFGIFPFINEMMQTTGHLKEADVGFYSGFIVCMIS
jgi:hypothetical protein